MPRLRTIKPGFFENEILCSLSPYHRLAFAGLWCWADRSGRLEDRPVRLRANIFPYEALDLEPILVDLARTGFIRRYEVDGHRYIQIRKFDHHQNPHKKEKPSIIPEEHCALPGQARCKTGELPGQAPLSLGSGELSLGSGNLDLSLTRARARGEDQDQDHVQDEGQDPYGDVDPDTDHPIFGDDRDADPRPKLEPPPSSESVPPEDPSEKRAREVADSAAERWKALRLVIAPNDRACQAGTWDVDSIAFKGRLLPHARELGDELVPAITWAMADVRRGPGFPGWRTVLRTPAKVLDALGEGALIEQFRAQRDAPPAPPPRAGATGNVRLYDPTKGSFEVPPAEANRLERQREQAARDRASAKASKLEQWRRYLRLGADVPAAEVMRQAKAAAEAGNGPLERGGEPTRVGEAIKEAIR